MVTTLFKDPLHQSYAKYGWSIGRRDTSYYNLLLLIQIAAFALLQG